MLIRANTSFAGAFSMGKGQIEECSDNAILHDLLSCGYVEEYFENNKITAIEELAVVPEDAPKGGIKNESKRSKRK